MRALQKGTSQVSTLAVLFLANRHTTNMLLDATVRYDFLESRRTLQVPDMRTQDSRVVRPKMSDIISWTGQKYSFCLATVYIAIAIHPWSDHNAGSRNMPLKHSVGPGGERGGQATGVTFTSQP